MKFLPLIWRNLMRKKTRTVFTLLSVLCTFLLFGFLMALRQGFVTGAKLPGADMIVTMSPMMNGRQRMPQSYGARIAAVKGVASVMRLNGAGFYYQNEQDDVSIAALDPQPFFRLFPNIKVPPQQRAKWVNDRIGAIVQDVVARKFGWKVGDHIPLLSYQRPGKVLEVTIDGIQDTSDGDPTWFGNVFVHFDYLSLWSGKNTVRNYIGRAASPDQTAVVAARIDTALANSAVPTITGPMQVLIQNTMSRFGDIGAIAVGIVIAALIGMLIVTANAMAQSVRERTQELAVMRALGFSRAQLAGLVIGESLSLTGAGGLLGIGCAWLITALLVSAFSRTLPGLYFAPVIAAIGVGLIALLSLIAALAPSVRTARLQIATALGRF